MTGIRQHQRNWLYLLFAISGFSGLIYESIWSHYLKLFLGHAAYAQTLVLAIFMGGMAIGAWISSGYGTRWKNLLLRYAIIEAVIGVCAIVFHKLFVGVTDVAYDSLIPALASPWAVSLLKWSLAAVLILPQSILLGMTFPLMSASLIRRFPDSPGSNLAMLYFTNSLGAAIGVLISGFVLIEAVGLPGTVLTAGLINIAVALVAWSFAKNSPEPSRTNAEKKIARGGRHISWRLLIATSFVTGAASFIYEIGWIRMLSLVLGTSTHAFELMLSAFIVGLAFGGFWMRHRIDRLDQPVRFLGWIQVAMGLLALTTLLAYNASFDVMQQLMRSLTPTAGGYFLFNLGSHAIAVIIMVPVTFCAGMTLPLITNTLLRGGYGEKSIGIIYAANTAGAIVGVFFAVHIGLSTFGLKGLIVSGATLDMVLGIVLLATLVKSGDQWSAIAAASFAVIAVTAGLFGLEFDRYKMASGVYRHGHFFSPDSTEILYHKDGKTATVDLIRTPDGGVSIVTNGKPDAKINMANGTLPDSDEATMTLAGAIALVLHPQARTAAIIGMGSGLTTHVLLNSRNLERVDTIEIEPAMIEAARGFRPRVEAPFSDPRSHFYIDDAKTYFSSQQSLYDIVISEPSNPWVSGVSGLYTDEFYRRARTHIDVSGIFVQWVHVYEMDFNLVASVMKAIGKNFSDYSLYATNDGDLLIVAVRKGKAPSFNGRNLSKVNLNQALRRISINSLEDLRLRHIGDRAVMEPLFASASVSVNSDFFPILDLYAVRARFMKSDVVELTSLRAASVPALELLSAEDNPAMKSPPTPVSFFAHSRRAYAAAIARDFYTNGSIRNGEELEPNLLRHVLMTLRLNHDCRETSARELWLQSVYEVMDAVIPYLKPSETEVLWRRFLASDCYPRLSAVQRDIFAMVGAIGQRNAPKMALLAEKLLKNGKVPHERDNYLLAVGMLGYLADNKPEASLQLWTLYAPRALGRREPNILLRLLLAHSVDRSKNRTLLTH